jgi:hypothetical protein
MDGNRFDDLTRTLAAGASRRTTVKGLVAGLAMALGLRHEAATAQAGCGNVVCAADPAVCNDGCVCCVFSNGNSRCMSPDLCDRLGGESGCPSGQLRLQDGSCADVALDCAGSTTCPGTDQLCNNGSCLCTTTIDDVLVCGSFSGCGDPCSSNDECPAGYYCQQEGSGCCGQVCVPFCGALGISGTAGFRAAEISSANGNGN